MKKALFFLLIYTLSIVAVKSQQTTIDSLLQVLTTKIPDKERVDTHNLLAKKYLV